MNGHGEPRNLNNFDAVSHGILQAGLQNLSKFAAEICGPYLSFSSKFSRDYVIFMYLLACHMKFLYRSVFG